ncbi:MAG: dTDP-glucose 4,6-dehydratase RfbB [Saliniramus fredricksonii]|uniref:UDP-glucuronate decarboxylase n=1 Tax=Saliniramus fredricksonii TaxID=1653334 RepID=A0A0P8BIN5_9HYPH|nr:UDP-glucuronic acid decarboxylase family protein [Saliniramus fredricksonii]KPQ09142.1 MAG: dTDP-glucose 4,6-dehydratase RfbB [Saliniramus fredricksonii]SCC81602.1 UDP-glucuronate decarboxylase [Saliniramus fredricksonii]
MASITENGIDLRAGSKRAARSILVTGGAGFLGSHLCDLLLKQGHEVISLDNYFTGSVTNLGDAFESARFRAIEHDIILPIPEELPRFDEIYNLACPASPVHYQLDPLKTALTSAGGVWNVMARARRDNARIFHASTSEVYGDPTVHPQPESYHGNVNPIGPRACYDEGKRFAETILSDFTRSTGLPVRIARIFNTYGPRMHPEDGRVVSNFIVQALLGRDLTIYGSGRQTRSFCFMDDLIAGFDALMHAPGATAEPVNLGNPHEITVVELAEMVLDMVGGRSRILRLPLPVDDPQRRRPDISRAKNILGWKPRVPLEEGLAATIRYFDRRLAEEQTRPRKRVAAAVAPPFAAAI